MSTLPVVMFGMRWAGSWRTNSTFFSSSKRPLARICAMVMSMPTSSPLSFSKCQGALVLPVPTISLPRSSTVRSRLPARLGGRLLRGQRHRRGGDAGDREAGRAELQKLSACMLVFHGILRPVPPLSIGVLAGRYRTGGSVRTPLHRGSRPVYWKAIQNTGSNDNRTRRAGKRNYSAAGPRKRRRRAWT